MGRNVYSEELKNKGQSYVCYPCDTRTVRWNGKEWVCRKCKRIHKTEK
jgi:ribosomal protein L37AE/L43A